MSMSILGTLALVTVLLGQAEPAVPPPVEGTVLVMPLGAPKDLASPGAHITTGLVTALARHPALSILTQDDISELVSFQKARENAGCATDLECALQLATAAKARFTVSGYLGSIGKTLVLNVVLLDAERLYPVARIDRSAENVDELLAMIPGVVDALLGIDTAIATPTATTAPPADQRLSFAVLELKPAGIPADTAQTLTQVLSVEIKSIDGATVISRSDVEAMIGAEKLRVLMGADCDTECMLNIGGALGVDRLVVGDVGLLADTYAVTIRLIDPRRALVENRVTETFRGESGELLRAVRHAGRRLLGVKPGAGAIAISAEQPESTVNVDHVSYGNLPLPPIEVAAGRHVVRVEADGYYPRQTEVYVDPGQTTAMFAHLDEVPARWYEEWWVWTAAGAVAAGAGVAIALLARPDVTTGVVEVFIP